MISAAWSNLIRRAASQSRPSSLQLPCRALLVVLAATPFVAPAQAGEDRSFALRAKRVLPVSPDQPPVLEPGLIVVREGRIVAVGSNLDLPPDLPLIELKDSTVTPGLVAASTSLIPPHTEDESVAAGYRAIDAYNPYDNYSQLLAGGVTTVHLSPGHHRLITGQGAVVKVGGPLDARVLQTAADLTLNLGERAFRPPRDVTYRTPASSDVPIPPAVRQRPDSRLGQFLALDEALEKAGRGQPRNIHGMALGQAWREGRPLRVQTQRGADTRGAIEFLRRHNRSGYLVGGAEAHVVRSELVNARLPLVYQLPHGLRGAADIGYDPDALEADLTMLGLLSDVRLAFSVSDEEPASDLRLAAATALQAGLPPHRVIEAVTRAPAEILGVEERVGSLAPGRDADLVVFSGDPLVTSSHVQRVYIGGELVFTAPANTAIVVKAGTIWVNEQQRIRDGALLIENGRISAIGGSVPHPPFARLIDAGERAFVAPGFIDAFGHLGFDGDRASTSPELSPATIVGAPDVTERRVARVGITTVMLAPYAASPQGSQVAAVKTAGRDRESRVLSRTAGVYFDFRDTDPMEAGSKLKKRLEEARKYLEKWQKYDKDLAEWKEKRAKGETVKPEPKGEVVKESQSQADPITGVWSVTLSGGPIDTPTTATMRLRLSGSSIEGRIDVPGQPEEAKVTATFDGKHISGSIEVDTPFGPPTLEADLVEDDHIVGVVALQEIRIDIDARRTSKEGVEFKVVKKRTRGKEGQPLPPTVDEALEPLRAVLEKKIPLLVEARSSAQIDAVLNTAMEFEVAVVLLDAHDAAAHAPRLAEHKVGVIVPTEIVRWFNDRWYHQADDLSRSRVAIAFQSNAEDAARALPVTGLRAVERGLSADAALAAFTTQPSRMYKLDDKIGSLEPGRQADLVIFSGHPFEAGSRVLRVIINGEEVE